jgi:CheY-like chemotaxis protein
MKINPQRENQTPPKGRSSSWYENYITHSMVVLNVDDDAEDREFFCDALRQIDPAITCLVAGSGMEALSLLQDRVNMPDYIFLDINMPMMDGKQCLRALKSVPDFESIPVIMYSTSTNTREIRECYRLGAEDFLIKPYSYDKLVNDLMSVFAFSRRSPLNN